MMDERDVSRLAEDILVAVATAKDSEGRYMALRAPYESAYRLAAEAFGEPDRAVPAYSRPPNSIDAILPKGSL